MHHGVVDTVEHDVFERSPSLVSEVILLQQSHDVGYRHLSFSRHEFLALFGQWGVHADGNVALALVEKPLQFVFYSHATHRDAFRAPLESVVGCKDICSCEHVVEIVHWLALSHEHDVSELVAFRQGAYLVEDVGCSEVALKTLFSCLAEEAVHLASHL